MVSSGQAFAYRKYLAACDSRAYLGAETEAQRQRRGFWSVPGGIQKPWDWRHGTTGIATTPLATPTGGSSNGSTGVVGYRYKCKEIGSYDRTQELLREGHTYLDKNGDGIACKSLKKS
jgi:hypothetical protein